MGLFDKIKAAAAFITGSGAKVTMELDNPSRQSAFAVKIKAEVAEADIKIDKVYIQVRSTEDVIVKNVEIIAPDTKQTTKKDFTAQENLVNMTVDVAGPQELKAKTEHRWEANVQLPPDAKPTYAGRNANHRWYILAALDKSGTDPNTGWIQFDPK